MFFGFHAITRGGEVFGSGAWFSGDRWLSDYVGCEELAEIGACCEGQSALGALMKRMNSF